MNTLREVHSNALSKCVFGVLTAGSGLSVSYVDAFTSYVRAAGAMAALLASVITIAIGIRTLRNRR